MTSFPPPSKTDQPSTGALYLTVWRWHFYAGILVAPFIIFLAVTGAIYVWKPQYEAWRYQALYNVPAAPSSITAEAQLAAAKAAAPANWRAQTIQPAFAPGQTAQIVFKSQEQSAAGTTLTVFVDPATG